jgi:ribosomal protein S18 acetylase RimI-like enzyme
MTNTPTLVPAQYAPQYRALMLHAYAQHPEAFTSSVQERERLPMSWWEARLAGGADAAEIVIGAFAPDADGTNELAGVVGLSFDQREKARHKSALFGMYVAQQHRRSGWGDALVRAALQHARQRSAVRLVQLTVTLGNEAAYALYARHGFVEYGLEPYAVAVGDTYVSKCHMWCDLRAQD